MKRHIIIIHEVYGVTKNLQQLKTTLEKAGYSVDLPSLYKDDYVGTDESLSYEKFHTQVGLEKSYKIINELIQKNHASEIILLGFSVGATVAWLHSSNTGVGKIIGIYGSRIRDFLNIKATVKTYLFFCKEKSFNVEELNNILNRNVNVSSKIIPGKHGFYSGMNFNDSMITEINDEILEIIKNP